MYKSFHVARFKCFRDLQVDDLRRLTVITGANNVGKSSLLEAMYIHAGAGVPSMVLRLMSLHGYPWPDSDIFHNLDLSRSADFEGSFDDATRSIIRVTNVTDLQVLRARTRDGTLRFAGDKIRLGEPHDVLGFTYEGPAHKASTSYLILDEAAVISDPPLSSDPPFPTIYLDARDRVPAETDAERFSTLEVSRQAHRLVESLRVIEPRVTELRLAARGGRVWIHGDIGLPRLLPLNSMGEGMNRLASLVLAIASASNGVVLVDEIESGLHYSVLARVWTAIYAAAVEFNTQVVLTTHSMECLRALGEVAETHVDLDFVVCRLECKDDDVRSVVYDREAFLGAIEGGLEVR